MKAGRILAPPCAHCGRTSRPLVVRKGVVACKHGCIGGRRLAGKTARKKERPA